jgi:hypothetical protein
LNDGLRLDVKRSVEDFFRLAAPDREIPMRGDLGDGLLERIVAVELRALAAKSLLLRDAQRAARGKRLADQLPHVRVLCDPFRADIARAGERGFCVGHPPLSVHETGRFCGDIPRRSLRPHHVR